MLGVVLLLSISSVLSQSLPDPPKVIVSHALLEKFGVTEDVTQKGEFQRLMMVTPGINSTNPRTRQLALQAKEEIHNVYKNILDMSVVDFTRKIIQIYQNLPEEGLAQYIAAHVINMYTRFCGILNKLNDDVVESLGKLLSTGNRNQQVKMCIGTPSVSIAAIHFTREIEKESACRDFINKINQDDSIVRDLIEQATEAKKALQKTNNMLEDENEHLSSVLDFVRGHPVIPKIYHTLMYSQVVDGFKDYNTFYFAIEDSKQIANVMGMPLPQIKSNVVRQFIEFLKRVEL